MKGSFINMNEGKHRRVINIFGEINSATAEDAVDGLTMLDSESDDPIIMRILSGGGDVKYALLIIDIMNAVNSEVYTVGMGECSSAASLILAAGAKGHRSVSDNIHILLHEAQGSFVGDIYDIDDQRENFRKRRQKLLELYSRYTGRSVEQIEKDIRNGLTFLSGEEAVNYGLADSVL